MAGIIDAGREGLPRTRACESSGRYPQVRWLFMPAGVQGRHAYIWASMGDRFFRFASLRIPSFAESPNAVFRYG
jgi:hypothetical protein